MGQVLACASPGELQGSDPEGEFPQRETTNDSVKSLRSQDIKPAEKTKLKEKEFNERVRRMSDQLKYVRNFLMLEHWQKEGDNWVKEEVNGSQYTDINNSPRNPEHKPKFAELKEDGHWEWVSDLQTEPDEIERAKKKVTRYRRYGVFEKPYTHFELGSSEQQSLAAEKTLLKRSLDEKRRQAKEINETIKRLKRELEEAQRELEKVEDEINANDSELMQVDRKLVDLDRSSEESHIHSELFEALRYLLWHTELFNRVNDELISDDESKSESDNIHDLSPDDKQLQLAKHFQKSDPKKKYFTTFQAKLAALSEESAEWYRHQRRQRAHLKKKGNMGEHNIASLTDLEACRAIYVKLGNRMRVAVLRDRPYRKRNAHKVQVNDLLTRDIKLLTRTKCPFRIQELLILSAYFNIVNPPEESDDYGTAFNRIEKLDDLFRDAVDGFERRVYYRIDIKKKIEDTINEIEKRHEKPENHKIEYLIQGFMTFKNLKLAITSHEGQGKMNLEESKEEQMKRDMKKIMRAKYASDVLGMERQDMLESTAVKAAYKKLAKRWHPDYNKEEYATTVFNKVSNCKERLDLSGCLNFEFSPEYIVYMSDDDGEFPQEVGSQSLVAPDVLERLKRKDTMTPSASAMRKQEAELLDNLLIMLEGWLEDFYPSNIPLVLTVFNWYRRIMYIELCTRKQVVLNVKNFSQDELNSVESKIAKCFKKAAEKHYKDIYAKRIRPYLKRLKKTSKDAKLNLADQEAKTHFNGFLDVFQKNIKYTITITAKLKAQGLVTKPPTEPLGLLVTRIVSVFQGLLPKIIAMKLVDDDGKPYDVLDKNAQEAFQAATKVRQNIIDCLALTKLDEENDVDQFHGIKKQFDWIESEIASRLENWIDVRCRNLSALINRTVNKVTNHTFQRTLTGTEIDNLNVDAFTFLSKAIDSFMKTLRNLPASTAKNKSVLKSFFDRLTRLILVFVNSIKPNLPKRNDSGQKLFSFKKKKAQKVANEHHIARFKDLGFEASQIKLALSQNNSLMDTLGILLSQENAGFGQEKKVEDERKNTGLPETIDYYEVAQQVQTFDNVQDHVARLSKYIQKEINNLHPELKAIFPELCDSFSMKTGRWLRDTIDDLLPNICEKMIQDNLKARETLYPSDMLYDSDCLQVLLSGLIELLENFNIMRKDSYRSLLQNALDLLCTEIEWIFRKSSRKFKRAWVVDMEKEGGSGWQTLTWGAKLEMDLNDMKETFLDLGLPEDEIIKSTESLEILFNRMRQTSSSLVFQHVYLKLSSQMTKEKGVEDIVDERSLLYDVLAHRWKSHAQSYVKLVDRKNVNILNELRGQELFDESAFNNFYAPVPVSILMAIGLNNQAKLSRKTNPYIDIKVLKQTYKSKVITDTIDPVWKDEGYIFSVPRDHFSRNDNGLELIFEVRSERIGVKNNFLGIARLVLTAGHLGGIKEHTLQLQGKNFDYAEGIDRGQIRVEVDTKWIAEATEKLQMRPSKKVPDVIQDEKKTETEEPSIELLFSAGQTKTLQQDKKKGDTQAKESTSLNPFGRLSAGPANPFANDKRSSVKEDNALNTTNPFGTSDTDKNPFHRTGVSNDAQIPTNNSTPDNLFV